MDGNESIKKLGGTRRGLFLTLQIRVPLLEYCPEYLMQCVQPRWPEEICAARGLWPLLLLADTPADDLVTRRLDQSPAEARAVAVWFGPRLHAGGRRRPRREIHWPS